MSNDLTVFDQNREVATTAGTQTQYVTFWLAGQLFGLTTDVVKDVLLPQEYPPIPLAPPEVVGALNLRGHIVTVLDVRKTLAMDTTTAPDECMSIVVERGEELYDILVEAVHEVVGLSDDMLEPNPGTLSERLKTVSRGIYKMDGQLLVILDPTKLFDV